MIKNPILKNILSALAILVFSVILLILIFLLYTLINDFYTKLLHWGPNPGPITSVVVLAVLSWFIFRSKLATLYKAIYTTVPVAIVLAVILICCVDKGWPVLGYSLSALFSLGILAYLFLTKKS